MINYVIIYLLKLAIHITYDFRCLCLESRLMSLLLAPWPPDGLGFNRELRGSRGRGFEHRSASIWTWGFETLKLFFFELKIRGSLEHYALARLVSLLVCLF